MAPDGGGSRLTRCGKTGPESVVTADRGSTAIQSWPIENHPSDTRDGKGSTSKPIALAFRIWRIPCWGH